MKINIISALGLVGLGVVSGCGGGSNNAVTTVPTAHLAITLPAGTVKVGTPFTFTVNALDATNAVVPTYVGTVQITTSDKSARLPANATLAQGKGTFTVTFGTAGSYTITASDTVGNATAGTSAGVSVVASRFQSTGSMGTARISPTATLLVDGEVLIAGGYEGTVILSSTEVFDPASGSFTPSGDMGTARASYTATLLNNGQVLITGGSDSTGHSIQTAELFTPTTGAFTATGSMVMARSRHTATLLPSGEVLITGGLDASGNVQLNTAELYDPSSGTFTLFASRMNYARAGHNATLIGGKVLIIGGGQPELFDPVTQTFALTGSNCCFIPSQEGTATWLSESSVLVLEFVWGPLRGQPPIGFAQLYDANSGTFASTGGPFTGAGRWRHSATLRTDGTVLVAGGYLVSPAPLGMPNPPGVVTASAELFDPLSGTFVSTDDMVFAREYHAATLLNNGDVLITGGEDAGGNALATAELYH